MFTNSILMITGGTGSFGKAVLNRFIKSDIKEIRIFSRDEKKQDDLRKYYNNPKIKFYLGDVRDINSLNFALHNVDFVFHAAALKQVPSCEFFPMEAVKTNVIGTDNLITAAESNKVKKVICLSTDKAVYPINSMGLSKALMEKLMVAKSKSLNDNSLVVCGTRYGNVMASRGSVIPLFVDQILSGKPITITDPKMTRFMMSLEEAVELVLYAFQNGKNGDIFVQKAPATTVEILANALREILKKPNHPIEIIGTRHGEKLYETLLSREERLSCIEENHYFRVSPDNRDLNYGKYVEVGDLNVSNSEDYNSHNTRRLNLEETISLLMNLDYIQSAVSGKDAKPID
jgi:UDP-glucose 4-epimerase